MKFAIFGRIKKDVDRLKLRMKYLGLSMSEKNPSIVISFGGDGTFLLAERKYPGIPKLILRDKSICMKCNEHDLTFLLDKLKNDKYKLVSYDKIEAKVNGMMKYACNDVVIRNKEQYYALRFRLKINDKWLDKEYIGDGLVVASAFGSGGYYNSITKEKFSKGYRLTFNNITTNDKPIILNDSVLKFKLLRNQANLSVDNDDKTIVINKGDKITIRKSKKKFKIIQVI